MDRRSFLQMLGVGTAYATVVVARPDKLAGEEVAVGDLSDLDITRLQELARGAGFGDEEVYRVDLRDYFNAAPSRMVNYGVAVTIIGHGNSKVSVVWRVSESSCGQALRDEVEFQTKRMEVKLRERHDAKKLLAKMRVRARVVGDWKGIVGGPPKG